MDCRQRAQFEPSEKLVARETEACFDQHWVWAFSWKSWHHPERREMTIRIIYENMFDRLYHFIDAKCKEENTSGFHVFLNSSQGRKWVKYKKKDNIWIYEIIYLSETSLYYV